MLVQFLVPPLSLFAVYCYPLIYTHIGSFPELNMEAVSGYPQPPTTPSQVEPGKERNKVLQHVEGLHLIINSRNSSKGGIFAYYTQEGLQVLINCRSSSTGGTFAYYTRDQSLIFKPESMAHE